MFPCMISKAATVDVICSGEGVNRNGVVQLMFAELQMLTPMVPTREVYFIQYCNQLSPERWAIVDVSIDKVEENINISLVKYRKHQSGCIVEDKWPLQGNLGRAFRMSEKYSSHHVLLNC